MSRKETSKELVSRKQKSKANKPPTETFKSSEKKSSAVRSGKAVSNSIDRNQKTRKREPLEPPTSGAQTVATALTVLETVAEFDGITLSEVAKQIGIHINQAYRLLSVLENSGYLERDGSKVYRLGQKLLFLGHRVARHDPLVQVASPMLDWLASETNETVSLAFRFGHERIIVDSRESQFALRLSLAPHARIPLNAGALGFCLLAFAPLEVQQSFLNSSLQRFTANTLATREALESELTRVREKHVSVFRDGYEVGIFSVAAPILGNDGMAKAAISIGGATARLDKMTEERYCDLVKNAAETVSSRLW